MGRPRKNPLPTDAALLPSTPEKTRKRPEYRGYYDCVATVEFTNPVLAGMPDLQREKLVFERDPDGNITLLSKHWRAVIRETLRLVDEELYSTAKDYVYCGMTVIPADSFNGKIKDMSLPVGDKGLSIHETLPAGTQITTTFTVPASILPSEKFQRLLERAGNFVGLSAKHRMGYGRFKVMNFQVTDTLNPDETQDEDEDDHEGIGGDDR